MQSTAADKNDKISVSQHTWQDELMCAALMRTAWNNVKEHHSEILGTRILSWESYNPAAPHHDSTRVYSTLKLLSDLKLGVT